MRGCKTREVAEAVSFFYKETYWEGYHNGAARAIDEIAEYMLNYPKVAPARAVWLNFLDSLRERLTAQSQAKPNEQRKEVTMSIEQNIATIADSLARIADALEALNAKAEGTVAAPTAPAAPAAPAPAAPAPATRKPRATAPAAPAAAAPGETVPTLDDLKDNLRALVSAKGADEAKKILAKYGAGKVSDVKEKDYIAFSRDLKNAANDGAAGLDA